MKRLGLVAIVIVFTILIFCNLGNFVTASQQGLLLVAKNVLPVLFPFFFISSLLVGLGFFSLIAPLLNPLCSRLYKTSGKTGGVLLVSLLSGYPTGARLLGELYQNGEISRSDAIKTSTWTSTASPAFVIGSVGAALYHNPTLGIVIFTAMTLGSLLNGLIYRNIRFSEEQKALRTASVTILNPSAANYKQQPIDEILNNALYSAVQSILIVSGWIVIFFIAAAQLQAVLVLPHSIDVIISSVLEMTTGVFRAGAVPSVIIPCLIISFGGLSVAMQGQAFFKTFKMPVWFYFLYKLTHTLLSVLLCAVMIAVI